MAESGTPPVVAGYHHSGVVDTDNPVPYSVVVFRDPDHIQLELIYMPR